MELVSILIPSYKPRDFRDCLTSALAQTWHNVEIIVSDDCKTEEIKSICDSFYGLITYSRNPNPGALGHNNIRRLLELSKGTYIKYLCDDDLMHPFCIQYLVEALQANQGSTLAFSPRKTIDDLNHEIDLFDHFPGGSSQKLLSHDEVVGLMAREMLNPIGEFTTVLFRRADVVSTDGRTQLMTVKGVFWRGLSDVALFIHLLGKGQAVRVGEVLSYFRQHASSNSNHHINPEWLYVVSDWKLLVDYAMANCSLSLPDRLSAYGRLIDMLEAWCHRTPALKKEFTAVLREVEQDIRHGKLPSKAARPLLSRLSSLDLQTYQLKQ